MLLNRVLGKLKTMYFNERNLDFYYLDCIIIVELANKPARNSHFTIFIGVLLPISLSKGGVNVAKKSTKKEQRQNKQFVEKLLMIQGIKYDEWLDELHQEYIQENNKVILNALDTKLNKQETKEEKPADTTETKEVEKQHNKFNKQGGN